MLIPFSNTLSAFIPSPRVARPTGRHAAVTALALMLAMAAGTPTTAAAQGYELSPSRPVATDSERFQLQERDATLTRRVRGFGYGFLLSTAFAAAGSAAMIRCVLGCPNVELGSVQNDRRFDTDIVLMSVGMAGQLVTLIGLLTSSTRRRRHRRRLAALDVSPVAAVTDTGAAGGLSLRMRW